MDIHTKINDFLVHLMSYTQKARAPFVAESTRKSGNIILLISILLLLLVSDVIKINAGEIATAQFNIMDGKENVLLLILFVILSYFSIDYYYSFKYDVETWRYKNTLRNQESRRLMQLIVDEKIKSVNDIQRFIDDDKDLTKLSKALKAWLHIEKSDKELVVIMEKNYSKIRFMFNLRMCFGYIPLIVFFCVFFIVCYDKLFK